MNVENKETQKIGWYIVSLFVKILMLSNSINILQANMQLLQLLSNIVKKKLKKLKLKKINYLFFKEEFYKKYKIKNKPKKKLNKNLIKMTNKDLTKKIQFYIKKIWEVYLILVYLNQK